VTPIDQLRTTKEKLPPELRAQILALGAAAVLPLIEIVKDEPLGMSESPAEGWPPIHAVELLADLRAAEAVEPMLDVLVETDFDNVINSRLMGRLPDFGAAVLEPALLRLEDADERDVAYALVAVLAKLGVKDERIFDAICDVFDEDVVFGAMYFADYGDDRALSFMTEAVADFEPNFSNPFWRHDLSELLDAHQRLGGVLGDDLRAHVDALDESWRQHVAQSVHAGGQKVGRNDPCPCRSGRKYKKCCLGRASASPSIVASAGVSREKLALAEDYFRQKDAGPGPAQQFLDFAEPLIESTDRSKAETQQALTLAQFLWNVAVTRDPEAREAMLGDLLRDVPDAERDAFERIAREMIERPREMFPEQHGG